ncbi:hypothetical protein L2E82_18826 [Cichorium intybus]|uniref:Uncharacterized protein n=1 Tax=Cichorium intybus TaxID=13427 RepID=A0ACB9FA85_CICIN|nr:hypothetical protein L2E82_18826 [Cichorium intybus]
MASVGASMVDHGLLYRLLLPGLSSATSSDLNIKTDDEVCINAPASKDNDEYKGKGEGEGCDELEEKYENQNNELMKAKRNWR